MIVLVDTDCAFNLLPFTYIRHVSHIRIGILTIFEKWARLTNMTVSTDTTIKNALHIPANLIPTIHNFESILAIAASNNKNYTDVGIQKIEYPWHIFQLNDYAVKADVEILKKKIKQLSIPTYCTAIHTDDIYIEEGAEILPCTLNATNGPIYISAKATIMEGANIRGSFFIGENSTVKMGATIYGATTIGPNCTVGGELKNVVIFANSNKAHHGYLGDSVIGEWCNLGAGTSNSNVKNTAGNVAYKLSNKHHRIFAGNKAGLLMADYSRAAIHTNFNTGTVVGLCCNIFGNDMPATYIPNFTWGKDRYIFEKAIEHITNWMAFKNKELQPELFTCLKEIYNNQTDD